MKLLVLLAGLFAAMLPTLAGADAPVQRRYYDVHATDAAGLMAGITVRSPLGVTALTELAPTQIHWQARRVGEGYVVDSVRFDAVIVQTLPRWVNRDRGRACLQRQWDQAMAALQRHEDVHRREYLEYAGRLRREALRLPPQPSPAALEQALTSLNRRLEAETVAWQRDYDRRTQHGRREGVVIRPC